MRYIDYKSSNIKHDLELRTEEFFKYIPHIKAKINIYFSGDYSDGYCCADCDGNIEMYIQGRLNGEISDIQYQIEKLNII